MKHTTKQSTGNNWIVRMDNVSRPNSQQRLLGNTSTSSNSGCTLGTSSSNNNTNAGTTAYSTTIDRNDDYNMTFIQTTIRRTIIAILIFALFVRLQMHYGSSLFHLSVQR